MFDNFVVRFISIWSVRQGKSDLSVVSCIIGPESVFAFRQKLHCFPRENWCKSRRDSSSFPQIMLSLSQVSFFGNSLSYWTTYAFLWILFCLALIPVAATHKLGDGGILQSSMTLRNHEKKKRKRKIQVHIWDNRWDYPASVRIIS